MEAIQIQNNMSEI